MRVVLDANVLVSALISTSGPPGQIIAAWLEELFELVISEAILDEIGRVLRYPRLAALHKLPEESIDELLSLLRGESRFVAPTEKLSLSLDESDNRYIECAINAGAEYIVTGDKQHLLPIGEVQGIRIVSPAVFIALLQIDRR